MIHQIIGCVVKVLRLRNKWYNLFLAKTVRIFVERGINDADFIVRMFFHHDFDKFSRPVPDHYIILFDTEILARKE